MSLSDTSNYLISGLPFVLNLRNTGISSPVSFTGVSSLRDRDPLLPPSALVSNSLKPVRVSLWVTHVGYSHSTEIVGNLSENLRVTLFTMSVSRDPTRVILVPRSLLPSVPETRVITYRSSVLPQKGTLVIMRLVSLYVVSSLPY